MELWAAISGYAELKVFIIDSVESYLELYDKFSKGKDKYANLYLAWLDYIRSYTCKAHQTGETQQKWANVLHKYGPALESTQRTMIAIILHAVQEAIQSQMSGN